MTQSQSFVKKEHKYTICWFIKALYGKVKFLGHGMKKDSHLQ